MTVGSGSGPEPEPIEGRLRARPLLRPEAAVPAGVSGLELPDGGEALLFVPSAAAHGADPPDALPLVVMLHGSGGDARQGIDLVRAEAERQGVIVAAPRSRSYTWDLLVGGLGPDVETLDALLARVFVICPVEAGRVAIGGFSDGASYALSLGFANGDLFSHVLAFSPGFMAPPMVVGAPSVFVSHGTHDRVLPIARTSRRIVAELRDGGGDVHYDEFAGGHEVPGAAVRSAFELLRG